MNDTYPFVEFPPNIPFKILFHRVTNLHKHWHPTVELLFILKGSLTAEVQGERSCLTEGDLLLVNSNEIHELRSGDSCLLLSLKLDMHKFDLPRDEADQLYFSCDSSKDEDKSRYDNLRGLIALIIERNTTQDVATLYDNKSFAYSLLKELTRDFQIPRPASRPVQDKYLERMNEIVQYVDEHYREDLRLNQLASAMHLSPPYLSSLFSRYLGTTFSDYYNSVRLGHAISDLVSTDDPIDVIALNNGYANVQAFGRAFKAKYETLPSLYRKKHREVNYSGMGKDRRTSYLQCDNFSDTPALDISALAQYLPKRRDETSRANAGPGTQIAGSWNKVTGTFGNSYRKLLGIGSAKEILYRDVQLQLEEIQKQIGFEYIKFHGLFSDDMMVVTRTSAGELDFNFRIIDMVFDFLFSIHLKPMIQLSFMPIELALDKQKMIFNNHYNTSQPAHLEEWTELVRVFFNHLIDRYGRETIRSLPVILWNNADSSTEMFGMQNDLAFFQMYRETYLTVKAIDPAIQMGAPSMTFMQKESTEWARRFFQWELEQGITPDFFCAQYYSVVWRPSHVKIDLHSWQPDHLVSTQSEVHFPLLAGIPLSTDPDRLRTFRRFLDNFKQQLGLEHIPTWITEWNLSVSHTNLIHDTLFAGCYVVKNVLEHSQNFQAMGYWSATDFIEEQPLNTALFHGGLGLMTIDGIRKPQFLAYQALRQLKSQILAQGEGYIVTRSDSTLSILLYNYEHFSDIFASNKTYNVNATNRYTPFAQQKRRPFRIHLTDLPDRRVLEAVEFINNRDHGSAYDYWVKMGAPTSGALPSLDQYRLEQLKAAAHPFIHTVQPDLSNGTLDYEAVLEPLEFRMFQIHFS